MLECDELTDQFKVKYDDRLDGGILDRGTEGCTTFRYCIWFVPLMFKLACDLSKRSKPACTHMCIVQLQWCGYHSGLPQVLVCLQPVRVKF